MWRLTPFAEHLLPDTHIQLGLIGCLHQETFLNVALFLEDSENEKIQITTYVCNSYYLQSIFSKWFVMLYCLYVPFLVTIQM